MDKKISPRVLHSAALLSPPSGILNQMRWEQEAADALGLPWTAKIYCPLQSINQTDIAQFDQKISTTKIKSSFKKTLAWFQLRTNYYHWLLSQQNDFDVILLRYYVHDPFQLWFLKRCKKPVYFVHHTLEVPELALPRNFGSFLRSNLDALIAPVTLRHSDGIIGVTQEIIEYEVNRSNFKKKSTHVYPNGIIFRDLSITDRRKNEVPELLFVANFAPWHGLDILLESIKESDLNFVLHLVGNVPCNLSDLTLDPRIKLHGQLNHNQISLLSEQCWIGLSSFALSRNKMRQACPLKVREYLMLGLPVYGDYQDIFPENCSFFKQGGSDLSAILIFANYTRNLEKSQIAAMAKNFINKSTLLKNLYYFLAK